MNLLRGVYEKALASVRPKSLIVGALKLNNNGELVVKNIQQQITKISLLNKKIFVLGAGKAVAGLGDEFFRQVDNFNSQSQNRSKISFQESIFILPFGMTMKAGQVRVFNAAKNNLPDASSLKATQELLQTVDGISQEYSSQKPVLICFISGGGSALLASPIDGVTLQEKLSIIQTMVRHGANIQQLNTIRGRLSRVKHGKLARRILAQNADLVTFILSDVINDPIQHIAGGPTILDSGHESVEDIFRCLKIDKSTFANQKLYDILCSKPAETCKNSDKFSENLLSNNIIGNNKIALEKAIDEMKLLSQPKNVHCSLLGSDIDCSAEALVEKFVDSFKSIQKNFDPNSSHFIVGSGETHLEMKGPIIGLGGRCQESALLLLAENLRAPLVSSGMRIEILFAGTDGFDGPTPAAGVHLSLDQSWAPKGFGLEEVESALQNHDSYGFLHKYMPESLVLTGHTGTNVMDLYMAVVSGAE